MLYDRGVCRQPLVVFISGNLTLILLMWSIWWASNNASIRQVGFNAASKGSRSILKCNIAWNWLNGPFLFKIVNIIRYVICHVIWYVMWCDMWYDVCCDVMWCDIWCVMWCDVIYDMMCDVMWYDTIWYVIWYDIFDMWCDMIYMLCDVICDVIYDMMCDVIYDIWQCVMWYMIRYGMIWWYDMIWYVMWSDIMIYMIWCYVMWYIYDVIRYDMIYNIFNCNWVATQWQQYSTHVLYTDSTQNNTVDTDNT